MRVFQNVVEQDTFTANGKTLVSDPFTFTVHIEFDSSGNVTQWDTSGVVEKVPLPDGTQFVSAGLIHWLDHPNVNWMVTPDRGGCKNLEGFIEALSP